MEMSIEGHSRERRPYGESVGEREPAPTCLHCQKTIQLSHSNGLSRVQHLVQHARWSLQFTPFHCSVCGFSGKDPVQIRGHLQRVHKGVGEIIDKAQDDSYQKLVLETTKSYFPDFAETVDLYFERRKGMVWQPRPRSSATRGRRARSGRSSEGMLAAEEFLKNLSSSSYFEDFGEDDLEGMVHGSMPDETSFDAPDTLACLKDEPVQSDQPSTSLYLSQKDLPKITNGNSMFRSQIPRQQPVDPSVNDHQSQNGIHNETPLYRPANNHFPESVRFGFQEFEPKPHKLPRFETEVRTISRDSETTKNQENEKEIARLKKEVEKLKSENIRISLLLGQCQGKKALYKEENKRLRSELEKFQAAQSEIVELD